MEELLNLFGQIVKDARHRADMTQDALAEQAGVTTRYIMAIENENKHPSMPVLFKIIRILKISTDTIFYPEIQHTDREKEQLMHMIQLCSEKEIKIAAATVKALLDAR
ncbi:DNA-binding XRE family transcriptional regulator [Muricomes intestini]|uniref:Helix-turn-helix domain-containing protein n=2 Tax=Clostridia TaxID=186801 RepID=A0A858BR51_9FIRM|nr:MULTISPECIES: helix-turn-helix domain-containing protein [Clostridia]QIB68333.1 helix-turn-helix domain-containing protein [Aminipila butyrica]TCS74386.1 DNA-binding XRE family transcriptional regulator [Muricomes intestini]